VSRGSNLGREQEIFSSYPSTPALGPTSLLYKRYQGSVPGVK